MELKQIPFEPAHVVGTIVYVAVEHQSRRLPFDYR